MTGHQLLFLTLPFVLLTILQGYYYTWEADTDLAQPAATDLLFLFLFLLASFHLVNGRYGLFLVSSALGITSLPSGRLFLVLSVLAFALSFRPGRRVVLMLVAGSATVLLGAELSYKIYSFYVPQGSVKFDVEFLLREYLVWIRPENLVWDVKTLGVVTGIVPLLACGLLARDRVSRYFMYVLAAYLAVVIVIPNDKLHYFMPFSIAAAIVAMRKVNARGEGFRRIFYALSTLSFVALIIYYYPKNYVANTLARDFGGRSCILVPSYEDAVRYSLPTYDSLPIFEYGINPHAWIHYSDLTLCPKDRYDFYFSMQSMSLDGYELHRLENGGYFYARAGALLEQSHSN
jgi:hypothetical protein